MRRLGLQGVVRGRPVKTTVSDSKAPCPKDKVNRQFAADRPNRLWVADFGLAKRVEGEITVEAEQLIMKALSKDEFEEIARKL